MRTCGRVKVSHVSLRWSNDALLVTMVLISDLDEFSKTSFQAGRAEFE